WCATRGAVAAVPEDEIADPRRAAVCGLGRVAAQEHPERWGGTVDLPPGPGEAELGLLCAAPGAPGGEDQTAVRPQGLLARRLERAPLAGAPAQHRIRPGTVLVTGGTGALGAQVARRLAAEPEPPHLLLVGRDRKSTRLNSSHVKISYAVFCLKKKKRIPSVSANRSPT